MTEENKPQRKTRKQEFTRGEMTWALLEKVLNNYYEWRAVYQQTGNPDLELLNGITINIYDVLDGIEKLPPRQKQAVVLSCLENRKEIDVAKIMGFTRWSSQVGSYKRKALKTLCETVWKNVSEEGK